MPGLKDKRNAGSLLTQLYQREIESVNTLYDYTTKVRSSFDSQTKTGPLRLRASLTDN